MNRYDPTWLLSCFLLLGPFSFAQTPDLTGVAYPPAARAVIDVTQPPYSADPTGRTDCSAALIRAYDDALRPVLEGQRATEALLAAHPDTTIGYEIHQGRGVTFPHRTPPSRILYFPNGTYLVSEPIVYSFTDLQNSQGSELNRQIHFLGQSEAGVVLRLTDNNPAFDATARRPVLSFMREQEMQIRVPDEEDLDKHLHSTHSNVAMSNTIENFTIDVGSGNPGAVGLLFHSSNNGAIRHVTLRAGRGSGSIGLAVTQGKPMGNYTRNLTVTGFDVGIQVTDFMLYSVFEHLRLEGQRRVGLQVFNHPLVVRDLRSSNTVPAARLYGPRGQLLLVDSELSSPSPGGSAILHEAGNLVLRNVRRSGYATTLSSPGAAAVLTDSLTDHYVSGMEPSVQPASRLQLPVEETPPRPWPPPSAEDWISVNDMGAVGDGLTDDTPAIQRALDAGAGVVYFQPGQYLMNGAVTVPDHVKRIDFMFCDLRTGEELAKQYRRGAFVVAGASSEPLHVDNLFAWEEWYGDHFLIEHASTRPLVLRDLHTQIGATYLNTAPGGRIWIENVCGTRGHTSPGKSNFIFTGQRVWARQLNPERGDPHVINDGGDLWVLGFKTEGTGVSFVSKNGARTQVQGGVVNNYSGVVLPEQPILRSHASTLSFTGVTNGKSLLERTFRLLGTHDTEGEVLLDSLPERYDFHRFIPYFQQGSD